MGNCPEWVTNDLHTYVERPKLADYCPTQPAGLDPQGTSNSPGSGHSNAASSAFPGNQP